MKCNFFQKVQAQLDSRKYQERERATKQLRAYGERVAGDLKEALKSPRSLEVQSRIRSLLEQIKQQPLEPYVEEVMQELANHAKTSKPAKEMLQLLAKGASGYRIVQLARDSLNK